MLKEGDIVYGGAPGQSGFYFDKATLEAATGSRQNYGKVYKTYLMKNMGLEVRFRCIESNEMLLLVRDKLCHQILKC